VNCVKAEALIFLKLSTPSRSGTVGIVLVIIGEYVHLDCGEARAANATAALRVPLPFAFEISRQADGHSVPRWVSFVNDSSTRSDLDKVLREPRRVSRNPKCERNSASWCIRPGLAIEQEHRSSILPEFEDIAIRRMAFFFIVRTSQCAGIPRCAKASSGKSRMTILLVICSLSVASVLS